MFPLLPTMFAWQHGNALMIVSTYFVCGGSNLFRSLLRRVLDFGLLTCQQQTYSLRILFAYTEVVLYSKTLTKGSVHDAMRCTMIVKIERDDVTHDTSLTVMMLLLPCISVERASNIVPFNVGSLMFHYSFAVLRGEQQIVKMCSSWLYVFIFFCGVF